MVTEKEVLAIWVDGFPRGATLAALGSLLTLPSLPVFTVGNVFTPAQTSPDHHVLELMSTFPLQ